MMINKRKFKKKKNKDNNRIRKVIKKNFIKTKIVKLMC